MITIWLGFRVLDRVAIASDAVGIADRTHLQPDRSIKKLGIAAPLCIVWRFIIIRGFGGYRVVNELLALPKPFYRT